MAGVEQNRTIVAGVKRNVTQAAINDSIKRQKVTQSVAEFLQDTNASQQWKISEGDDFFETKTMEVYAKPTELTNDEIVFEMRAGDKYLHLNSCNFNFGVEIQKKVGTAWVALANTDKVILKPGAVLDLINRDLEARMMLPGDVIDHKVINIKQDKTNYISRFDRQRKYNKLYVEKELEEDMQLAKDWTYPFQFSAGTGTHEDMKPGNAEAAFGARAVDKKVAFVTGSIHEKCQKFATELKGTGKKFKIYGAVLNPVFLTPIIPPRHGMQVKFSLGRDEYHAQYIEDYTELATATEPTVFRLKLLKTGANKIFCQYDVSKMTTTASAKYNEMFKNGKNVETAAFMVFKHSHVTVEADAVEIQSIKLPNTTDAPIYVSWELLSQSDYNHESSRDNFLNNSFLNYVKKMKWQGTTEANTVPREGTSTLDLTEEIDKAFLYNQQKRWMLDREQQSMSDIEPAYGVLNGATSEVYDNLGESKVDFMKMDTVRHISPIITEFDPSHGKYGPDQKHSSTPNLSMEVTLELRKAIGKKSRSCLTLGLQRKIRSKKKRKTVPLK